MVQDQLIEQLLSSDVDINDLVTRLSTNTKGSDSGTASKSSAESRNQVNVVIWPTTGQLKCKKACHLDRVLAYHWSFLLYGVIFIGTIGGMKKMP